MAKIEEIFAPVDEAIILREDALSKTEKIFQNALEKVFRQAKEDKKDWKWVKLGDVCEIIMGQSPSSKTYNKEKKGLPFYQGKKDFGDIFLKASQVWCEKPKKTAEPMDILISVRAPVGDVNISKQVCAIGRGLAILRGKSQTDTYYLFYYLLHSKLSWKGKGSTFESIGKQNLIDCPLPLPFRNGKPDLEKQKEIARYFDDLNEKIRKINELQQAQTEKFKQLKEQVLYMAFRGQLI